MDVSVVCFFCEDGIQETIDHLFLQCKVYKNLWDYFASSAGVNGLFLQLKDSVHKWWNAAIVSKINVV